MFRYGLPVFLILFLLVLLASACTTNQKHPLPEEDPDLVYRDFMVWGDEESGLITVKLQFRPGGRNENSFLLEPPSKIEFDGELIEPDSAGLNGAYYEVIRWARDFGGRHTIVFTDEHQQTDTTEFDFPLISLKTELPALIGRADLFLELEGIKPRDKIRILLTDTSFTGRGVERVDTVEDGRILITRDDLEYVKNGPVYLEFLREQDIYLRKENKTYGRLSLTYGLKREIQLLDSLPLAAVKPVPGGYPQAGLF